MLPDVGGPGQVGWPSLLAPSGTAESTRVAGEWIRANLPEAMVSEPRVSEGDVVIDATAGGPGTLYLTVPGPPCPVGKRRSSRSASASSARYRAGLTP